MTSQRPQPALPEGSGFPGSLILRIRLVMRLMVDGRVNPILKLLPAFGLVYLLVPDLLPGPIDDGALLWLGGFLFVDLCPPEVVDEHWRKMTGQPYRPEVPPAKPRPPDDNVIDGEFRDVD